MQASGVLEPKKEFFTFSIFNSSGNARITLQADNERQRQEWIQNIRQTTALLNTDKPNKIIKIPFKEISLASDNSTISAELPPNNKIIFTSFSLPADIQQIMNIYAEHQIDHITQIDPHINLQSSEDSIGSPRKRSHFNVYFPLRKEEITEEFNCVYISHPSTIQGTLFLSNFILFFGSTKQRLEIHLDEIESATLSPSKWRSPTVLILTLLDKQQFQFKFPNQVHNPEIELQTHSLAEQVHYEIKLLISNLSSELRNKMNRKQENSNTSISTNTDNKATIRKLEKSISLSSSNCLVHMRPSKPLRIIFLSIGTRGDVQPYIALGLRLQAEGHKVTIATHLEFQNFVSSYGLQYRMLPGNPRDLMDLCVSKGFFTVKFMQEAVAKFVDLMEQLLWISWQVCQDHDVIIEAPMIQAGVHIAEKLNVQHFIAFTMPFSRTKEYGNPFIPLKFYNKFSHLVIEQMLWLPLSSRINRFRVECCNLPPLKLKEGGTLNIKRQTPFLYCFSASVVPKPIDWPEWVNICGYWTLDQSSSSYQPDKKLLQFIEQSKEKPVYVGFGSIVVDADELWSIVLPGILDSGKRVVLSCGWTSLNEEKRKIFEGNENIFCIDSCPHDWLFPRMKAAVHHGGAGTTAASLLAACPTFIISFFGDQPFWGKRVVELGAGATIPYSQLTKENFASTVKFVSECRSVKKNVQKISKILRNEDGLTNAVENIYRHVSSTKE